MSTDDIDIDTDDAEDGPSEATLARIKSWPVLDLPRLFTFVAGCWHWSELARKSEEGAKIRWEFITGGWSGNEALIAALGEHPTAWGLCWKLSECGGRHVFEVNPRLFTKDTP